MGFLGTLGKAFSPAYSFLGGSKGKNPADAAAPYLNQVGPMAERQLNPWINQGQQAANQNLGQYNKMIENPADFYEQLRSTYTPSEGYKFREEQARKALHGSAAAGGYATTEPGRLAEADLIRKMMQEDEGSYVDRLLGIHGAGLQGNELGAQRGFQGVSDLTNILGSTLGSQAGLAFQGQASENQRRQDRMRVIAQLIGAIGGGAIGGPAGASVGSSIGGAFGGGRSTPSISDQFHVGMGR